MGTTKHVVPVTFLADTSLAIRGQNGKKTGFDSLMTVLSQAYDWLVEWPKSFVCNKTALYRVGLFTHLIDSKVHQRWAGPD